jgi:low affinity iron permease
MRPTESRSRFGRLAKATARVTGRLAAFILAVSVIRTWLLTGPLFRFSDTWRLVINTGTTIITFLMVFLIQATQNRDAEAVQVKLDELHIPRVAPPLALHTPDRRSGESWFEPRRGNWKAQRHFGGAGPSDLLRPAAVPPQ